LQGQHILIDREDRKSQIRTFKDGIKWLKRGVPLMAFPEGKRSKDGRLMEFKGGLFSMAAKTKCPIVPITLSHAHAVMPCNALFPVQSGRGKLHVHVHEPIHAVGRSEDELVELVRQAFISTLPEEQQPLDNQARLVVDADLSPQNVPISPVNGQHHVASAATISHSGPDEMVSAAVVRINLSKPEATEGPTSEEVESQLAESAP
jgi:1-acyl-sn-glycerol-3-phosphate acyltransferase